MTHYDEFIAQVADEVQIDDREEVDRITRIVLATLGERIHRTQRDHLASELPAELRNSVYERQTGEATRIDVDRFSLEEFYIRVRSRAGTNWSTAVKWSKAVLNVLQRSISAGEMRDIRAQLPKEYDELFESPEP